MTLHLGTVPASTTLYIPFATYGGTNGESITCSGLAVGDILLYKNGSVTQRSSTSGYTLLDTDGIDFDGITGIHGFSIDLSDNTDSGFFSVGGFYWVVVSSVTVDSQTVSFIAATFRIGPAEVVTGYPVVDVGAISGDTTAADNLEAAADGNTYNLGGGAVVAASVTGAVGSVTGAVGSVTGNVGGNVTGSVGSVAAGGIAAASFAANAIDAAALAADAVTEIQSGLALEATAQSILTDTAEIGAAGAGLTEAGGTGDHLTALATAANLATVAGYLDTEIAAILADTNELQTDWADGGRLDLILDARATQAALLALAARITLAGLTIGNTGNDTTHVNLALTYPDGSLNGQQILFYDNSTGLTYANWITDWVQATGLATLGETLPVTPEDDIDFVYVLTARKHFSLPNVASNTEGGLPVVDLNLRVSADVTGIDGGDDGIANFGAWTETLDGTGALTADSFAADSLDGIGDWALASVWTSTRGGFIDNLNIGGAVASAANLSTVAGYIDTEISTIITHLADIKGATWNGTTDSLEAIRDRGDAAWTTATGFSTFDPTTDVVAHVTLVDTCTTNTDMRGTDNAALAATALSTATWTNTRAGYLDNLSAGAAALEATAQSILADTGTDGVVVAAASKTGYTLSSTGVDGVWDEVLVGSLTARSALANVSSGGLGTFSVNDASATTTSFVTDLTSSVNDFYNDLQILFTSGALAGQMRVISDYVGSTKTVTLDEALTSAPANGVTFTLQGPHTHTKSQIADAFLGRTIGGGSDGGRTVGEALATLRNKVAFDVPASGQFTVYDDDDTTALWTGTYTRGSSSTGPLTVMDPG